MSTMLMTVLLAAVPALAMKFLYPSKPYEKTSGKPEVSVWRKSPSGLSAKFLQSAARIICLPLANKFHTCSLRCVFVHVHAAAKNDFYGFAASAANSAKPFSTV